MSQEKQGTSADVPSRRIPYNAFTDEQLAHRYKHHAPFGDQAERILTAALTCRDLTPVSPEQTRALNALDEAMFLFNAAIARAEMPDL